MSASPRWIALALALTGCASRAPAPPPRSAPPLVAPPRPPEPTATEGEVTEETPAAEPQHPLDLTFGSHARLLGYDLEEGGWDLGELTVTLHWRLLRQIEPGWRIHVATFQGDDDWDLRDELQPEGPALSAWAPGEVTRQEVLVRRPYSDGSPEAALQVSLCRGREALPVEPRGAASRTGWATVLTLPTAGDEPLEVSARRAPSPPRLDGRPDDTIWREAQPVTLRTVARPREGRERPEVPSAEVARVRLLWDDEALYVAWEVTDDHLVDRSTRRDDHLWLHDAVAVLLGAVGDGGDCAELQVSPGGRLFDAGFGPGREPRPWGRVDRDLDARVAVAVRGTLNRGGDRDRGYSVELALPWRTVASAPPAAGDSLRASFLVWDEGRDGAQRMAGWRDTLVERPYSPRRFGRILLEE